MLRQQTEQIRNEVQDLQQADASIGRIETLLRTEPRLVDGPGDTLPDGPLAVEFDRVSFDYGDHRPATTDHGQNAEARIDVQVNAPITDNQQLAALHHVSFRIEPGRVLGVVGRTGSGKTTLTRLLPRFYDPSAGAVRLGGMDLRDMQIAAVRQRIGLVTQDVHLFHASVRDNLTLFDESVPDEQIRVVLETLGLSQWLRELPEGLDTIVGSGGVGLSAGQAQVLACARIFLRDPDLVILDEASSRLDPATERLVHMALSRLLDGRTGIIVAHRLSTVAFADDILVLDGGQVREYGPRNALAADPTSHFAGLLRAATEEILQ
jgi:ATP-binding cassette subfamily B protein